MTAQEIPAAAPLTSFSEEEILFRSSVREFAKDQIAPLVREMDEHSKFNPALLKKLFDLGLMGIEIPEEYGGQGGSFFQCVIAIEEISAVDPSAGVVVDVQNTIVNNAILRWGNAAQKRQYLSKLARDTVGCYALSEAGSGSDAFGLARTLSITAITFCSPAGSCGSAMPPRAGSFCSSPTSTRRAATRASRPSSSSAIFPAFRSARRKTSSAFVPPPPASSFWIIAGSRARTFWAKWARATRSPSKL